MPAPSRGNPSKGPRYICLWSRHILTHPGAAPRGPAWPAMRTISFLLLTSLWHTGWEEDRFALLEDKEGPPFRIRPCPLLNHAHNSSFSATEELLQKTPSDRAREVFKRRSLPGSIYPSIRCYDLAGKSEVWVRVRVTISKGRQDGRGQAPQGALWRAKGPCVMVHPGSQSNRQRRKSRRLWEASHAVGSLWLS